MKSWRGNVRQTERVWLDEMVDIRGRKRSVDVVVAVNVLVLVFVVERLSSPGHSEIKRQWQFSFNVDVHRNRSLSSFPFLAISNQTIWSINSLCYRSYRHKLIILDHLPTLSNFHRVPKFRQLCTRTHRTLQRESVAHVTLELSDDHLSFLTRATPGQTDQVRKPCCKVNVRNRKLVACSNA